MQLRGRVEPTGEPVVLGDHLRQLARAGAGVVGQPLRRDQVERSPVTQQDGLVRDVTEQCVLEDELDRALERRMRPPVHQLASHRDGELLHGPCGCLPVGHRRDDLVPEDAADDAGALDGEPRAVRKSVEPGLEDAGQRRGNVAATESLQRHLPLRGLGIDDDRAVVDEHLHDLLDEERVAIGPVDDQVDECGRHLVDALQDLVDELASGAAPTDGRGPAGDRRGGPAIRVDVRRRSAGQQRPRAGDSRRGATPTVRGGRSSRRRPSADPRR